jgi:hypothetical protein
MYMFLFRKKTVERQTNVLSLAEAVFQQNL